MKGQSVWIRTSYGCQSAVRKMRTLGWRLLWRGSSTDRHSTTPRIHRLLRGSLHLSEHLGNRDWRVETRWTWTESCVWLRGLDCADAQEQNAKSTAFKDSTLQFLANSNCIAQDFSVVKIYISTFLPEDCAFCSRPTCHRSLAATAPRWQQQHNGMSERLLLWLGSNKRG